MEVKYIDFIDVLRQMVLFFGEEAVIRAVKRIRAAEQCRCNEGNEEGNEESLTDD